MEKIALRTSRAVRTATSMLFVLGEKLGDIITHSAEERRAYTGKKVREVIQESITNIHTVRSP